ncbi:MAG: hypothetical protein JWO95_3305, partial [Verrucomicrobiales bacterium]|nr:hypothetical protein [Verrucomicrobiales bacterium]
MTVFDKKTFRFQLGVALAAAGSMITLQEASARSLGLDVSSYQGSPSWSSIATGRDFAFAKATEGATINDGSYRYNISHAKSAGVLIGAYHFAHPNLNSPGTESSHFWSIINGDIVADGKSLQPTLDFEVFSGTTGASSYTSWANAFNDDIKSRATAKGLIVKPILYTSSCSACNFGSSVDQWIPWLANYNGQSSQTGTPWSVCSSCDVWSDWTVWQYSSSGSVSGVSGGCDVDVYHGTLTSLKDVLVIDGNGASSYAPAPAAVAWGVGRIDVVVRGGGDAIYHKYYISGQGWLPVDHFEDIGGTANNGPGIASWGVNRLDVFCPDTSDSLRHKYFNGTDWLPTPHWEDVGGTLTSAPAACSWGPNRIDIVVKGGGNSMYHKWWDGSAWQPSGGFQNLGGSGINQPGICSWAPGRLDVFYRGSDNSLQHMWDDGSGVWAGPQSLGGTLTGGVSACSWGSGRIDVVVRGGQNHIYHKYYIQGTGWLPTGGFEDLGGSAT